MDGQELKKNRIGNALEFFIINLRKLFIKNDSPLPPSDYVKPPPPSDLYIHPTEGWTMRTDHQLAWEMIARGVWRLPIPTGWIVRVNLGKEHVFRLLDKEHAWCTDVDSFFILGLKEAME